MRIALCLSGYFDSLKDLDSKGDDGFQHIKKHILSKREQGHQVDVFIHNWQPEREEYIRNLYDPKKAIFEDQIDFDYIATKNKISRYHLDPNYQLGSWTIDSKSGSGYVGPERLLSMFYSVQKSFELAYEYEKENDFRYDCVIKSRFDLGRVNRKTSGPGKQNPFPCQCIVFDPNYDMENFYQAYWDLFNEGPADMWFYSSSENMKCFSSLYDKVLKEYLQIGSDYSKAVVGGWLLSSKDNFRSNEIFKEAHERDSNLHTYPKHMVVNGILLMKWFLEENDLWEKSKYLVGEWE